jgi:cytoskeleton protein RodZ
VFDGVSWADVRDARRQRLVYQQFKAGQSATVAGVPPFKVYLSNAKAVRMRYAGEPYDVSAHQTGIYARFSVGTAVQ